MLKGFVNTCMPVYTNDSGAGTSGPAGGTQGAPAGGTSGAQPPTNPPAPGGEGGQPPAGKDEGGQPPAGKDEGGERKFTQAELDAYVGRRLDEHKRSEQKKADDAKRKADEQAAAANGQWQQLAEQRAAELEKLSTELEGLRATAKLAERYAEQINSQIDGEIELWAEEVRKLDPGKKNLEARRAWIEQARPLAQKLGLKPKAPATEAGKGNGNGGAQSPAQPAQPAQPAEGARYRFQSPTDVKW